MFTEEYFMNKQIDLELEQLALQLRQIELRRSLLMFNKQALAAKMPDEISTSATNNVTKPDPSV